MRTCHVFLVLFFLSAPVSMAATYVIQPDGTGDFPTIQAGILGAADGDVIELASGVFYGEGNRDIRFFGKAVTVRSQSGNPETCVIDCEADETDRHRGFRIDAGEGPSSVLSGIGVTGGYAPEDNPGDWGGAILCIHASPTIENCVFRDSGAGWGGGMLFWDSGADVSSCWVEGNWATQNGGGIYVTTGAAPTFYHMTVVANSTWGRGGAFVCNSCSPQFSNCTAYGNGADGTASALWTINGAYPQFENCLFAFNSPGAAVSCEGGECAMFCCDIFGHPDGNWTGCIAGQLGINGNISEDPWLCDPAGGDFTIRIDSPCAPFTPPNPDCDLIGAWPIGCDTTPVSQETWGSIKAMFK